MKLKTVEIEGKTYAEVSDGKPVYVDTDNRTIAFDAPATVQTISRLNGEAKGHREAKEAAETKLRAFEGLDATAARDAMEKLSKIDAKKLVEAGDMDAAIQAAVKPYAEKVAAFEKKNGELATSLQRAVIGNAFGQSRYAADKLTPAGVDLVRTMFGERLKVEGDRVIAYDPNGQKLYSKSRPGEPADFDEAVETFVESYPFKEHILKGAGATGGGARGGNGGGETKVRTRTDFEAMPPKERAEFMAGGGKLTD